MDKITTVKSTSGLLRTIRQINAILRPLDFLEKRFRKYELGVRFYFQTKSNWKLSQSRGDNFWRNLIGNYDFANTSRKNKTHFSRFNLFITFDSF